MNQVDFDQRVLRAAVKAGVARVDVSALARLAGVSEAVARRVIRRDASVSGTARGRVLSALGMKSR